MGATVTRLLRLAKHQTRKRHVVVVMREREGSTLPAVFKSECATLSWRFPLATRARENALLIATKPVHGKDLHGRHAMGSDRPRRRLQPAGRRLNRRAPKILQPDAEG